MSSLIEVAIPREGCRRHPFSRAALGFAAATQRPAEARVAALQIPAAREKDTAEDPTPAFEKSDAGGGGWKSGEGGKGGDHPPGSRPNENHE